MANGQLWYGTTNGNGGDDERIVRVNNDGTGQTTVVDNNPSSFPSLNPADIGLDTARGYYFAIFNNGGQAQSASLVRGSLTGGAPTTLINYTAAGTTGPSGQHTTANSIVSALVVDPFSQRIFVGVQDETGADGNKSGIRSYSYDAAGNVTDNGFLITQTSSGKGNEVGAKLLDVNDFAFDRASGNLYFTETGSGGAGYTGLFRVNVNTPGEPAVQVVSQTQFPDSGINGYMRDVEVDAARNHVFFSTYSQYPSDGTGTNSGYDPNDNGIWMISTTGGANQTATKVVLTGAPGNFYPEDMTFDATTNQLYVETSNNNGNSDDAILVFQLANDGQTGTLLRTITPAVFNSNLAGIAGMTFNDLPDIVATGGNFTEGPTAAAVLSSATVADNDSLLKGATVQITTNYNSATDSLNYTAQNGISGVYSNGTLTLSGNATAAQYQAAIRSITFIATGDNPTNSGAAPNRGYTITVSDGSLDVPAGSTNTTTGTFTVTGINDAPVIGNITNDSVAYTQNATAVKIDEGSNAIVTDADSRNFEGGRLTVTVSNGQTGDKLDIATTSGGITATNIEVRDNDIPFAGVSGRGTSTLTFSLAINASPARVKDLLQAITFETSSNVGGTRSISYTLVDGDGIANSGADTGTATSSVAVTIPNEAPVVMASGGTTAASEQIAVVVDSAITLSDADNDTLSSVRVQITGNFQAGEDVLAFTNNPATNGNITGSYNGTMGVLTLTSAGATATIAQFQAALRSVTYTDGSDNPNTANRTISFTANDGTSTGAASTKTVSVAAVNDAPTVAATGNNPTFTEGDATPADVFKNVTVSPIESGQNILSVTLTVDNIGSSTSEALVIDGTTVEFTDHAETTGTNGLLAQVIRSGTSATVLISKNPGGVSASTMQSVIDGIGYTNISDAPVVGSRTITLTSIKDNGGTADNGTDTTTLSPGISSTVTVAAQNDAPDLTPNAPQSVSYQENAGPTALLASGAVSDADRPANYAGGSFRVEVTDGAVSGDQITLLAASNFSVANGKILQGQTEIGTISGEGTSDVFVSALTAGATPAVVNQLVKAFGYSSTSDNPGSGDRTISFTFNDGGNVGGSALADTVTQTVTVTPVNDAPTVEVPTSSYNGQPNQAVLITGITFDDKDGGTGIEQATFAVGSGTLTATASSGISIDSGNGSKTLVVTGTITDLNAFISGNHLKFIGTDSTTLNVTIDDQGHTGGTSQPDTDSVAISLNALPTTPTDTNNVTNSIVEGAAANTTVGITAASTDSDGGTISYSLSGSANGAFKIDAQSGVVSIADPTKIDYESSGPGHAYTITVAANDGQGGIRTTDFTIGVTNVDPTTPTDTDGNSGGTVAEGAAAGTTVGVTASSSDPNGPAVTYTLDPATSADGFAIDQTTGVVTVADPTKIDYETAPNHTYSITVQASDGASGTSTQVFSIGVSDVAPAVPTDANSASNLVAENSAAGTTVGVTASSSDPNGPAVSYSLSSDSLNHGFAVNGTTGVVTVDDPSKIDYENSGSNHSQTITVVATAGALSSAQAFTIAIGDVNEAPEAVNDVYMLNEGSPLMIAADKGVLSNDKDPENNNLTAIVGDQPAHGQVTLNQDGSFTYTPTAGYNGSDSFTYQANDGTQNSNFATVNLTVASVNDAPAGADKTVTTSEDTAYAFTAADFGFTDPKDSPANTLAAVKIASLPANGTLSYNGVALTSPQVTAGYEVSAADIAAGKLTFQAAANANGAGYASFTFQVRDNGGTDRGGIDTDQTANTVTLDVTAVNDAPALTGAQAVLPNGVENDNYTFSRAALLQGYTDIDTPTGSLTVGAVTSNRGRVVDNGNGTYTLVPTRGYDGPVTLSYNVSDGANVTAASLGLTLANLVAGNASDDVLSNTPGPDAFRGSQGSDTVSYRNAAAAVFASLMAPGNNAGAAAGDTYTSIENLIGSRFNDTLSGDGNANVIEGGAGRDQIDGGAGVDTASYAGSRGAVNVDLGSSGAQRGGDAQGDTLDNIESLIGSRYGDRLSGDGKGNTLDGANGNDLLRGEDGNDRLDGGAGNDRLYGQDGNDALDGGNGNDRLDGGIGNDRLDGGVGNDRVYGGIGNDDLKGGAGNDRLDGGAGRDVLEGGPGADVLIGGDGADRFVFRDLSDSRVGQGDIINDFSRAEHDRIDLSLLDAVKGGGNQAFDFIGTAAFTGKAGELHTVQSGANLIVEGDVTGDGKADFQILVRHVGALQEGDFVL